MESGQERSKPQQAIIIISAFTAQGNKTQLPKALNSGLDAGLSINEVKEILMQLYTYTGFQRSPNALQSLMDVLTERTKKGITDVPGNVPTLFAKGDKITNANFTGTARLRQVTTPDPCCHVFKIRKNVSPIGIKKLRRLA